MDHKDAEKPDATETGVESVTKALEEATLKQEEPPEEEDAPDTSLKAGKLIDIDEVKVLVNGQPDELNSNSNWEDLGLNSTLAEAARGDMGYERPSKIQGLAIPIISKGGNFIGQAQSGTGKTAAFSLGVLQRIDKSSKTVQAIVLSPTRELCRQNYSVMSKLAASSGISVALVVPSAGEREAGPVEYVTAQVVVCTPGKAKIVIDRRKLDTRNIKIFVLDEADEMLALQGQREQSLAIHKKLPRGQVCLFSATYNQDVTELAKRLVPEPKTTVYVPPEKLTVEKLFQFYLKCDGDAMKFRVVSAIYSTFAIGQSIIFCKRRDTAQELCRRMRQVPFEVSLLHGKDMPTEERDRVMDQFRSGEARVLITTNVLARGIDVLAVSLVINYDLPTLHQGGHADCETYLHRVGRSARYGNSGVALNLVDGPGEMAVLETFENRFNSNKEKGRLIKEILENQIPELDGLLSTIILGDAK